MIYHQELIILLYKQLTLSDTRSIHSAMFKTSLFLCLVYAFAAKASNVLVVFPVPSRSHQILGDELVKGLLKKGHHVTMISPFGMKEKLDNYTDIAVGELLEFKKSR